MDSNKFLDITLISYRDLLNPETTIEWKKENLKILTSRMSETQLKTFNNSYDEKIKFGKLVYSKNLKNKPQT